MEDLKFLISERASTGTIEFYYFLKQLISNYFQETRHMIPPEITWETHVAGPELMRGADLIVEFSYDEGLSCMSQTDIVDLVTKEGGRFRHEGPEITLIIESRARHTTTVSSAIHWGTVKVNTPVRLRV